MWTQKDLDWLTNSIISRLRKVLEYYNIPSKIQLIKGKTRYEVRISSKKLYNILTDYRERLPEIILNNPDTARSWIAGLYDAEGDKTGKKVRIWEKDKEKLIIVKTILEKHNIKTNGPYLEDKRNNIYVLGISSLSRSLFLTKIKPEHPKLLRKLTT